MPAAFIWTPEIEDELCAAIASGRSLDNACRDFGMPSDTTVYRHMAYSDSFAAKMATARAAQQDHEMEDCVRIADEATPEDVQVAKLRISTRQWRAMKLAPKKYGEKIAAEVTGANGAPLVPPTIAVTFVRARDPGEPAGEA